MEAKYRALVEQIPAVVFMAYLDEAVGEAYVSPQIEEMLGFSQRNGCRIRFAGISRFIPTTNYVGAWKPPTCFYRASRCARRIA